MTSYQITQQFNRAPLAQSDRKSIRLHNDLWQVIDSRAEELESNRTAFIRQAILEKLERLALSTDNQVFKVKPH